MPTQVITIQVGQCGNQLGSSLFSLLDAQDETSTSSDSCFFRHGMNGKKQSRCVLVDTEPKVIREVALGSLGQHYDKRRTFVGQSGRGNNWAFGYNQIISQASQANQQKQRKAEQAPSWNSSALIEDPNQEEFRILDLVTDGLRLECEACDFAPDFLMIHSLGGGSGSGLGSRILEIIRDEYPMNHIATASVAPRTAGDSPMQSYNTVMSLSFLQAYADAVIIFSNQEMLDAASKSVKGEGGATLSDANDLIARHLMGALWPLSPLQPNAIRSIDPSLLSASSRIRDIVCTAACDPCCKIVEARTAYPPSSTLTAGAALRPVWSLGDACKALNRLWPKFDTLNENRSIVTSGSLIVARGLDGLTSSITSGKAKAKGVDEGSLFQAAVSSSYIGKRAFIGYPQDSIALRWDGREASGMTSISEVASRSSVIGLVEHSVKRATIAWRAGAYIHWYERYGCGKEAVREAIEQMEVVVSCYRHSHGIQD